MLELMKNKILSENIAKWLVSYDTNHTTKTAKRYKGTHCLEKNPINFGMIFIIQQSLKKKVMHYIIT